jgi:hypothetical protein
MLFWLQFKNRWRYYFKVQMQVRIMCGRYQLLCWRKRQGFQNSGLHASDQRHCIGDHIIPPCVVPGTFTAGFSIGQIGIAPNKVIYNKTTCNRILGSWPKK